MTEEQLYLESLKAYFLRDHDLSLTLEASLSLDSPARLLMEARRVILLSEFTKAQRLVSEARAGVQKPKTGFEKRLLADSYTIEGRILYAIEALSEEAFSRSQELFKELGLIEEELKSAINRLQDSLATDSFEDLFLKLKQNEERFSPEHRALLDVYQARHYMRIWRRRGNYTRIETLFQAIQPSLHRLPVRDRNLTLLARLDALATLGDAEALEIALKDSASSFESTDADLQATFEFLKWRSQQLKSKSILAVTWEANSVCDGFAEKARLIQAVVERKSLFPNDHEVKLILRDSNPEFEHLLSMLPARTMISAADFKGVERQIIEEIQKAGQVSLKDLAFAIFGEAIETADQLDLKRNQIQTSVLRMNKKHPGLLVANGVYGFNILAYDARSSSSRSFDRGPKRTGTETIKITPAQYELSFGAMRREKLVRRLFNTDDTSVLRSSISKSKRTGLRIHTQSGWVKIAKG